MDPVSIFVGGWIIASLLLVGASAWWHWFTSEPRWFLGVAFAVLIALFVAIGMVTAELPLWTGWVVLVLAAGSTAWAVVRASGK